MSKKLGRPRSQYCKRGHRLTKLTTWATSKGRECKKCSAERVAAFRKAKKTKESQ